ncbi:MAG TPA: hypothetical protein VNM40_01400 [Candidatus Paceibacterota bacterium]|nr:hypothetical protein [Candidatus Paceibacterota bacterium]
MEALSGVFDAVPIDWLVLGGITVVVALDVLRAGLGRAIAISIALPLAAFLFTLVDETVVLGSLDALSGATAQAGLFAVLAVALFFLVSRMGLDYVDGGMGEPVQALLAGGATAAIFASIWLQMPILSEWWSLSDQVQAIFAPAFRFWWIVGSYAALAFARG